MCIVVGNTRGYNYAYIIVSRERLTTTTETTSKVTILSVVLFGH